MPRNNLTDLSATNDSNTDIGGANIAENCSPGGINNAIRNMKAQGKSVLIMAHRPAAIQECDMLLMLDGGNRVAFGPKEEVLKQVLQNHQQIARDGNQGGMK